MPDYLDVEDAVLRAAFGSNVLPQSRNDILLTPEDPTTDDLSTSLRFRKLARPRTFMGKQAGAQSQPIDQTTDGESLMVKAHSCMREAIQFGDLPWDDRILSIEGLRVPLKPHQNAGVRRMTEQEASFRGCLLADERGLGKTLKTIALVILQKQKGVTTRPTLIVMERCLLRQWEEEIQKFVDPSFLKTRVHYPSGSQADIDSQDLYRSAFGNLDVVLTTYEIVRKEYRLMIEWDKHLSNMLWRETPEEEELDPDTPVAHPMQAPTLIIYAINWSRVVLDEGLKIRNKQTDLAKALKHPKLGDGFRLFASATPYLNNYGDVGAVFGFLRMRPFNIFAFYASIFCRQDVSENRTLDLKIGPALHDTLSILLRGLMSRRLIKDHTQLPPIIIRRITFDLNSATAIDYGSTRQGFNPQTEWETQALIRPLWDITARKPLDIATNNTGHSNARISASHHAVHRAYYGRGPTDGDEDDENSSELSTAWLAEMEQGSNWRSTKVDLVMSEVRRILAEGPTNKIVCFDRWIAVLELLGISLGNFGILYETIHDKISQKNRTLAINRFRSLGGPRVLVASLKTMSTGHNLTETNQFFTHIARLHTERGELGHRDSTSSRSNSTCFCSHL